MLKALGYIALISAFSSAGFFVSGDIAKHYEEQKSVIKMLNEIKILLEYGVFTKRELFEKVFSSDEFSKFSEENLASSKLSEKEQNSLSEFYNQFGKTDLNGQLSTIEIYLNEFALGAEELRQAKDNKCRLARTAGILCGVFVCLIIA